MKIRSELHCHSRYSKDCNLDLARIIVLCRRRNISTIALTDHNEIKGAIRLKEIAPKWLKVIVGEEINTNEGEIIGLFLKRRIKHGLTPAETIKEIRKQKGLVLIPHPFDRLRSSTLLEGTLKNQKEQIDFIETFNSRCIFPSSNNKAKIFADDFSVSKFVGSDAHFSHELGNSICIMDDFNSKSEFKKNLAKARLLTRRSSLFFHLGTKFIKFKSGER